MALFNQAVTAVAAKPVAVPVNNGTRYEAMSMALTPSASFVAPANMVRPFRDHQSAAYEYATEWIDQRGFALLGDDMGLGKTQVMLALASERIRTHGGYVLIIAPPVALGGYFSDLAASFPHLRMAVLRGHKAGIVPGNADIYFVSDDTGTMHNWLTTEVTDATTGKKHLEPKPVAAGASMLIRDEIHRDKGNMGKPSGRARVLMALGAYMRTVGKPVVAATGTLLSNRPVEAYLPLQIIGGGQLIKEVTPGAGTMSGFLYRYCKGTGTAKAQGGYGVSWNGCDFTRLGELHSLLRQHGYMRREKAQLGTALPHSGWNIKPIALHGVLARYTRIENEFLRLIEEEQGTKAMWRKARAETITRMAALWEEAGKAKIKATMDYVADLLDMSPDRKVVVFYYHSQVFDGLLSECKDRGIHGAIINGSVTGDHRQQGIDAFQSDPDCRVMLAQIKAAGVAVTLTAAADAVFCQVPWAAGDLKQAADRILRIDQISVDRANKGEGVTWHVLQACHSDGRPTFDNAMWSVLEQKAKVCDMVNAGMDITMPEESVMEMALEAWYDSATAAAS